MKISKLSMILIGCAAVLCMVAGIILLNQKNTAPEIIIEETTLAYTEGDDQNLLLAGVTATDKEDGDLTSQVFVNEIVPMESGQANVIYGVTDSKGQTVTASRMIAYESLAEKAVREALEKQQAQAQQEQEEDEEDLDNFD